jgi:gliding motility-associated-like protein
MDQPVQLNAGGGSTVNYSWSPSTGLNDSQIENPIALLNTDQLYELHSISVYGCESNSNILIKRYKGPELFIPTAFTPNGDGLNDILNVFAIGMKTFYSFDVYNRFGVCLFHTTDQFKGWNGTYKGMKTDPGNYVVVAKAQDYRGKFIVKKVNVILLR